MTAQQERVLAYLREYGSITSREADRAIAVTRLASRICELRQMGINIKKVEVKSKNRYGEKVRFARYVIEED